jgi:hypothetical protein
VLWYDCIRLPHACTVSRTPLPPLKMTVEYTQPAGTPSRFPLGLCGGSVCVGIRMDVWVRGASI